MSVRKIDPAEEAGLQIALSTKAGSNFAVRGPTFKYLSFPADTRSGLRFPHTWRIRLTYLLAGAESNNYGR